MNENPSVRIESARSKTSNNGLLRNGSAISIARLYVDSKIVCFYESDYALKTIWRRPCSCHLVKINRYFFQPGRPVFIIVINTSCSGVCYRIYARQKFLNNALAPNGALALFGIFAGRMSCNKCPHTQNLLLELRCCAKTLIFFVSWKIILKYRFYVLTLGFEIVRSQFSIMIPFELIWKEGRLHGKKLYITL